MTGLLNRNDMNDSSDNESDKCDNIKENEDWSDKILHYTEDKLNHDNVYVLTPQVHTLQIKVGHAIGCVIYDK